MQFLRPLCSSMPNSQNCSLAASQLFPNMKQRTTSTLTKTLLTANCAALLLGFTSPAQSQVASIKTPNAIWNDAQSWTEGSVPSQTGEEAVINGGLSATVDSPFAAPIHVKVSNGTTSNPDGTLNIQASFEVTNLYVAVATQSSGRVEQTTGAVSVQELNLASMAPDPLEATYDILGGTLSAESLTIGTMGPGTLNLEGNGEMVSIHSKLLAGPRSAIRFVGREDGFPSLSAPGETVVESGATLTVVAPGSGTRPGKFTLIQAREPLAGRFAVEISGFDPGKARLLENEPGVVLEVN